MNTSDLFAAAAISSDAVSAAASMTRTKGYSHVKTKLTEIVSHNEGMGYEIKPGGCRVSVSKDATIREVYDSLQSLGYFENLLFGEFVAIVGKPAPGKVLELVDEVNDLGTKKTKFNEKVLEWISSQSENSDSLISCGLVNNRGVSKLKFDRKAITISQENDVEICNAIARNA